MEKQENVENINLALGNSRIKEQLGEHIRKLRKSEDLTLKQLADILGITSQSLSLYEKGGRSIDIEILYKISQYFDVSIDYLFGLSFEESPKHSHSTNNELLDMDIPFDVMEKLYMDYRARDFLTSFIEHENFEKLEELLYHTRYTDYELYDSSCRSFFASQIMYSICADIMKEQYPYDDTRIKPLSDTEKLSVNSYYHKFIVSSILEKCDFTYIKSMDDKLQNLLEAKRVIEEEIAIINNTP